MGGSDEAGDAQAQQGWLVTLGSSIRGQVTGLFKRVPGNRDEAVQIRPDNKPRLPPGFVAGHQERTYRTVGAMLGKGAFGVVYGAVSSDDNQWNPSAKYAIKACTKDYADNLKTESKVLRLLKGKENVPQLVDDFSMEVVTADKRKTTLHFLVTEPVGVGDLLGRVKAKKAESMEKRRKWVQCMVEAAAGVNEVGMLHRDVALRNWLVTKDEKVILIDFGEGKSPHPYQQPEDPKDKKDDVLRLGGCCWAVLAQRVVEDKEFFAQTSKDEARKELLSLGCDEAMTNVVVGLLEQDVLARMPLSFARAVLRRASGQEPEGSGELDLVRGEVMVLWQAATEKIKAKEQGSKEAILLLEALLWRTTQCPAQEGERQPARWAVLWALGDAYELGGRRQQAIKVLERVEEEMAREEGESIKLATLKKQLGGMFADRGALGLALDRYSAALDIWQRLDPEDRISIGNIQGRMGTVNKDLGKESEALRLYEEARKNFEQSLPSPSSTSCLAETLNNIAGVLALQGRSQEALELLKRSREMFDQSGSDDYFCIGVILQNVGGAYLKQGDATQALQALKDAKVKIQQACDKAGASMEAKRVLGKIVSNMAATCNSLGNSLEASNREEAFKLYKEALEHYEEALSLKRQVLPEHHFSIADTLNNMAKLRGDLGDAAKGVREVEKAALLSMALEEEHRSARESEYNQGLLLLSVADGAAESDPALALTKCQEACEIFEGLKKDGIPGVYLSLGSAYSKRGDLHYKAGEWDEAVEMYEKAKHGYSKAQPTSYEGIGGTCTRLARLWLAGDKCEKALEQFEAALQSYRQAPHREVEVFNTLTAMAEVSVNNGRPGPASLYYAEALEVFKRMHPDKHITIGAWMEKVARTYARAEGLSEAIKWGEEAVSSYQRADPPAYDAICTLLQHLGMLYNRTGDPRAALASHLKELHVREQFMPADSVEIADVLLSVAGGYYCTDDRANALVFGERALALFRTNQSGRLGIALAHMADLHEAMGNMKRALELSEEAAVAVEREDPSPFIAVTLTNLANRYMKVQGRDEAALLLYARALDIRRSLLPPCQSDIANALINVGDIYCIRGDGERALSLYGEALTLFREARAEDPPEANDRDIASTLLSLATAHTLIQQYHEAVPLCEEAIQIRERLSPPDHPELCAARAQLAHTRGLATHGAARTTLYYGRF